MDCVLYVFYLIPCIDLEVSPNGESGPRTVLTSLQSTCRFMSMAINR